MKKVAPAPINAPFNMANPTMTVDSLLWVAWFNRVTQHIESMEEEMEELRNRVAALETP